MKSVSRNSEHNLQLCELAFARLKAGAPIEDAHKGIVRSKITAGIVSVEAGLDRGYLKKGRKKHLPLLGKILAYRTGAEAERSDSTKIKYLRAKRKMFSMEKELEQCKTTMYKVLTQNVQLVETIRRLERFLKDAEMRV